MIDHEQRQELIAEVNVGQACADFMASDVGRYLLGCAKLYREELFQRFAQVSATDHAAIRKLQALSEVPELFEKWLTAAIANGRNARFILESDMEES